MTIAEMYAQVAALRAELDAIAAAVDAVEALRPLFQPPAPEPQTPDTPPARLTPAQKAGFAPKQRRAGHLATAVNGAEWQMPSEAAVRTALAKGSLSPKQLEEALGVSRYVLSKALAGPLRRVVKIEGSTTNRRIALAGPAAPAKEAP